MQQEATIQVQSKQVSREKHNKHAPAPLRLPSQLAAQQDAHTIDQSTIGSPLPSYNNPYNPSTLAMVQPSPAGPNAYTLADDIRRMNLNVHALSDPQAATGLNNPHPASAISNTRRSVMSQTRVPEPSPERSASRLSHARSAVSMISMPQLNDVSETRLTQKLMAFFDAEVTFAFNHANYPSTDADNRAPPVVKEMVMNAVSRHTAFPLMTNQHTRYFIVAKVIFNWILTIVFREEAFFGLIPEVDRMIADLDPTSTMEVNRAKQDYYKRLPGNSTLSAPVTTSSTILITSVINAHVIAAEMYNDRAEFNFEFPHLTTAYNDECMVNMDPDHMNMSKNAIARKQGVVRAAITPRVTRNDEGRVSILTKAGVLLKMKADDRR
ncbi:hypothetical protein LTR66_017902 [Elasticomyces elasticus]|nr:hypothetical protein LTR66_017902 [Elasticomyces elasticus]